MKSCGCGICPKGCLQLSHCQSSKPPNPTISYGMAVGRISKGSDAVPVAVFNPALEKASVKTL